MTLRLNLGLVLACTVSALTHGLAYSALGRAPKPKAEALAARVTFQIHEPARQPKPPEPVVAPQPTPTPPPKARVKQPLAEAAPPLAVPPPLESPKTLDLRGVTLTNEAGAGWSSAVGDGRALNAPLAGVVASPRQSEARTESVPAPTRPALPPLVAVADLSKRPVPPELTAALRDRYPEAAKLRGISGAARVQARIEADGRVRRVSVEEESFVGFGEACRNTLLGSQWAPPLDKQGRQVATLIHYTCRFQVGT